jgi:hypothetical protein
MIDPTKCLEPCATEGGNLVGRDPRQMGRIGLEAAGFEPSSPTEVPVLATHAERACPRTASTMSPLPQHRTQGRAS